MLDDLKELYQEMILDHNVNPRNFRALADATGMADGQNPVCGDHYTVYVRMDGEVLGDITFQGSGCAISKASASILTDCLKGLARADLRRLFGQVQELLLTGVATADLGKLAALAGVHKFPERIKCAMLPWHAVLAAAEGRATTVTTETTREAPQ